MKEDTSREKYINRDKEKVIVRRRSEKDRQSGREKGRYREKLSALSKHIMIIFDNALRPNAMVSL